MMTARTVGEAKKLEAGVSFLFQGLAPLAGAGCDAGRRSLYGQGSTARELSCRVAASGVATLACAPTLPAWR